MKWTTWVVALFIFLLGLFGILQGLTSSLSFDELIQYDILRDQELPTLLYHIIFQDHQLPLQYLLLHPLINAKMEGNSLFIFRSVSLLFSVGTMALFYQLTGFFIREKGSRFLGLAIFTSSALFINYAASARPYSPMLFFTVALLWSLLKFKKKSSELRWPLLSIVFFILLCLTHYFGVLYGVCIVLGFLCWDKGRLRIVGLILAVAILSVVTFWLLSKTTFLLPERSLPSFRKVLGGVAHFFGGPINFCIVIALVTWSGIYRKVVFKKILLLVCCPFVVSFLLSCFWRPLFEYRFFLPTIIFSSILVVALLIHLNNMSASKSRQRIVIVILYCSLLGQSFTNILSRGEIELIPDSAEASSYIKEELTSNRVIVICGNCPSFYLLKSQISCMQGWNFKKKSSSHPDRVDSLMVYTLNKHYCSYLIDDELKKVKSFKGIDIYERSFFSR